MNKYMMLLPRIASISFSNIKRSLRKYSTEPIKMNAAAYKFTRPFIITFDAYDTIYTPKDSIESQYHEIASKYHVLMDQSTIAERYLNYYRELSSTHPNFGKYKGWTISMFWTTLLERVFSEADLSQCGGSLPPELIPELVAHFSTREAYRVFEDVKPCLRKLQENGIHTVIASNADAGVTRLIIDTFELGDYFSASSIFLSYDLEVSKPDPAFFKKILLKTGETEPQLTKYSQQELLENSWHVGDEYKKDLECAQKAGMGAILLDRTRSLGYLRDREDLRVLGEKQVVVSSLEQVPKFFGIE
ncbi:unnamed protein product [Kuraishia capsulata CBS 1993]|uniref:Haloacid dehalogenase-like hydrolase domain-containing protein 3 n=1 Tax=Kuraishia capsulata CBS 1993 TaxID=1382522 RepID=W6MJ35_9ASCO|nr:uncharacterized protein KUCA_T00000389001 [Kuraishia capsulata CBS 1993]CDK24427.1 unnamed protein product [Kuraishia capsulata CBS 1993]